MNFASPYSRLAPDVSLFSASDVWGPLVASVCAAAVVYALYSSPFRRYRKRKTPFKGDNWKRGTSNDVSDPKWQLEFVSRVGFERQPILNRAERPIQFLLEQVVQDLNCGLRVMAQTSMGEIFRPRKGSASRRDCDLAYRSINSKRLDFVIVDRLGLPVLVVEYQGSGHYRERSFMRDAVKREVIRKADVAYLEIPANYRKQKVVEDLHALLRQRTNAAQSPRSENIIWPRWPAR